MFANHRRSAGARDAEVNAHVAREVEQHSQAVLQAQKVKHRIREGEDPNLAWEELQILIDCHALKCIGAASFVRELAKGVRR